MRDRRVIFYIVIVFIDDMDKFEEKEIKKSRFIKNTWYYWLINYIPGPIRKRIGSFKGKIVNLFKTKISKQAVYGRGIKQNQSDKKFFGITIILNMKVMVIVIKT